MNTNDVIDQTQDEKSKAKKVMNDLKDKAQEWGQTATKTTRKAAQATDTYVHENPWMVMGCLALTGALLGYLLASRRN